MRKDLGWEPRFSNIEDIILHSYNWQKNLLEKKL